MFGKYEDDYLKKSVLHSLEKGVNFIDTAIPLIGNTLKTACVRLAGKAKVRIARGEAEHDAS